MTHIYSQTQRVGARHQRSKDLRRRGFTLVETLVAITILLVAMVAPMTIAARGLQSSFFAREEVTAFVLAQEGIELVRARRDENVLQSKSWLADFTGHCTNANGCGVDARDFYSGGGNAPFFSCGGTACRLNYNSGALTTGLRGFYTYRTGVGISPSPFTRVIKMNEISADKEAEVVVQVSWQSGLFGATKTVTLQSRIFNREGP